MNRLRPEWGNRKAAGITKQEIVRWLQTEAVKRVWTVAIANRWKACFSLIFRVALDNNKIAVNPASRIWRKADFEGPLDSFSLLPTCLSHLTPHWYTCLGAVERPAKVPDYTWHKNRHTFASRLAMAGVDIRTIQQLLGHGTMQMYMRYAHLSPDHNQAAVDRLVVFGSKRTKADTG